MATPTPVTDDEDAAETDSDESADTDAIEEFEETAEEPGADRDQGESTVTADTAGGDDEEDVEVDLADVEADNLFTSTGSSTSTDTADTADTADDNDLAVDDETIDAALSAFAEQINNGAGSAAVAGLEPGEEKEQLREDFQRAAADAQLGENFERVISKHFAAGEGELGPEEALLVSVAMFWITLSTERPDNPNAAILGKLRNSDDD